MNASWEGVPPSWLERVGGADVSGWLTAFRADAAAAVDALLWQRFYLGPLNPVEPPQLLAGWLDALGTDEGFAPTLDRALASWVDAHWGRHEHAGVVRAHAWMTLASVVGFSASLPVPSRLARAAAALRGRFGDREGFLGSFSTAPACDPLGLYLAAIAEFQPDRSLASFWHRLCRLPEGVPPYHARYGLKGLRRLPAASPIDQGTLREEVVMGLMALAEALDRLVRHRRMAEPEALKSFKRLARPLVAAYPGSPRWAEHGLAPLEDLQERPRGWVLECVPALAKARPMAAPRGSPPRSRALARNPTWVPRVIDLMAALRAGHLHRVPDIEALLAEQRVHAQRAGDSDP